MRVGRAALALIAAALLLLATVGIVRAALPPEAARLQETLRTVSGLRADFVQIRNVSLTGEEIEALAAYYGAAVPVEQE